MIKKALLMFAFAFLLFLAFPDSIASVPTNVTASVTVTCPFDVFVNASPAYMRYGTFNISYSLQSITNCFIQNMSGTFILINSSNSVVYSKKLVANYTNLTKRTYIVTLNAMNFSNGTYVAKVSFANAYTKATNASKFVLLMPANIVIVRFYTPNTRLQNNQPLIVYANITNTGQLTSNPLRLSFALIGPETYFTNFTLPKLLPFAYDNISFSVPNATVQHGTYTAYATVYYSTTAPYSNLTAYNKTPTSSFSYYVVQGPPIKPIPPVVIPQVSLETLPLFISTSVGIPVVSQFSFSDASSLPETINISIAPAFSDIAKLSASSITVKPGETVIDAILFSPSANTMAGTYVIPVNISATIANATRAATEYVMLEVVPKTNGTDLSTQLLLTNNTNQASGTILIKAPANRSLSNFTLSTRIPLQAVANVSQIVAYGLPNNIIKQDGYYIITWHVSSLPKGQTTYAYYTLQKPNPAFLTFSQNLLQMPSSVAPFQILRILNIEIPTLYTNSTQQITISALYTGAEPQEVRFMLTVPPTITVSPAERVVNASTNQLLMPTFNITTGPSTGTFIATLYIFTKGYNQTYSLPLIVLPKPIFIPPVPTTTVAPVISMSSYVRGYAAIGIILAFLVSIILVFAMLIRHRKARPKYKPEHVEHLAMIKRELERSA
ncbi:MAG: hypothetical protein ACP5T4_03205 [Candidatus Micrarchaeia archaeon]